MSIYSGLELRHDQQKYFLSTCNGLYNKGMFQVKYLDSG